jgi:2-succinyl-5-enolpyruvyl-6-hydroxy-3-cyclohexene-1-carboxylate synthase
VLGGLLACQQDYYPNARKSELTIHLGEVSGAYYGFKDTRFWRVSLDGEVRDPSKLLQNVFYMNEIDFFKAYNKKRTSLKPTLYYEEWCNEEIRLKEMLPELPLSNVWLCQQTASRLPEGSVLHLGILNSLRSWNIYDTPKSVYTYSNVGGFGIDGGLSSLIGASLVNPDKIYFGVIGDLATFYDVNVLGNRHVGSNVRILVSNNGTGYEMHCTGSIGSVFGDDVDRYMAAGGHFGRKSREVLKHFASDLGFEYISAETKEEYLSKLEYFISTNHYDRPILFEIFVNVEDDDIAYATTKCLLGSASGTAKQIAKSVLGERGYTNLKKILGKQ